MERRVSVSRNPMTVAEAINGRRSVRSYAAGTLDRGIVHALLAAAVRAPTAVHEEPWAFVIIGDREGLETCLGPRQAACLGGGPPCPSGPRRSRAGYLLASRVQHL